RRTRNADSGDRSVLGRMVVVTRAESREQRAKSQEGGERRERRADTRFGRDCAQDGQVRRFPPVRTTCQSIGYERSRVQRQRKHANARFCKSGHVAGTPEVIHPKLVVFISEPISFFSSGRLRALRTTKILVPSGNDLRPDGHIGTPQKAAICGRAIGANETKKSCRA